MARRRLNNRQKLFRFAFLFIMLGLLLKAISIPFTNVHSDTNYYLNIGSNFINNGLLTPAMWRLEPDTNIIAGSGTGYGVLILVWWLKIFGISLYSGYVFMYIVGIIYLIVLYLFVREWWGSSIGGISAVTFTVLTIPFMDIFYVRMDALSILAYVLVLWLHLRAVRSGSKKLHFAVGMAIILAAEVHILALIYAGGLSIYYFVEHIQLVRKQQKLWVLSSSIFFFTGALIAGIVYLFIHVLPDPKAYFIIPRSCPNCHPASIMTEFIRLVRLMYEYKTDIFVFSIALGVLAVRRATADSHYLLLLAGCFLAQGVVSPPPDPMYMTHLLPLLGAAVGGAFTVAPNGESYVLSSQRLAIGVAIATSMFVMQFNTVALLITYPPEKPEFVDYVREFVPEDTVVMGNPPYYHHFLEYDNFLSYQGGEEYGIELRGEDFNTFWEREQPQVFVGKPDDIYPDDIETAWWVYMDNHRFQRVRPELWISGDLLETLVSSHEAPTISFAADETNLTVSGCTTLNWLVVNADAVLLNEIVKEPVGQTKVCSHITTDYTLTAYWIGGMQAQRITILVGE